MGDKEDEEMKLDEKVFRNGRSRSPVGTTICTVTTGATGGPRKESDQLVSFSGA